VLEGLRELGDTSLLAELVELFVDEAPSRLKTLRDAVEGEDTEAVEQTVYTLKGSCSNMGTWRMANLCAELSRSGDLTLAPELLDRVRATLEDQTK
jgi:HPt (histidine-containing phosphotransfer) domain-containing protein